MCKHRRSFWWTSHDEHGSSILVGGCCDCGAVMPHMYLKAIKPEPSVKSPKPRRAIKIP